MCLKKKEEEEKEITKWLPVHLWKWDYIDLAKKDELEKPIVQGAAAQHKLPFQKVNKEKNSRVFWEGRVSCQDSWRDLQSLEDAYLSLSVSSGDGCNRILKVNANLHFVSDAECRERNCWWWVGCDLFVSSSSRLSGCVDESVNSCVPNGPGEGLHHVTNIHIFAPLLSGFVVELVIYIMHFILHCIAPKRHRTLYEWVIPFTASPLNRFQRCLHINWTS